MINIKLGQCHLMDIIDLCSFVYIKVEDMFYHVQNNGMEVAMINKKKRRGCEIAFAKKLQKIRNISSA